jgi:quercetin dioxygenase-like cupin family protein
MSAPPLPTPRSTMPSTLASVGIAVVILAVLLLLPKLGGGDTANAEPTQTAPGVPGQRTVPPIPERPAAASVWGKDIRLQVPLQQRLDPMPPGAPYVFRVTELEMEPGAKIFEHRQIGVGGHLVTRGTITIDDLDGGTSATYRPGQAYFEGLQPLHRAQNDGTETNRVLMFDILPASRGFDGQQQFTSEGRHNEGEVRSGPYVQVPLRDLPTGPLMLRVTDMAFGPKAKTEIHTRLGPAIYFVQEGTATVRKDWNNSSDTYGTNGYFYESGREPFLLENKPARPARFVSVEILPLSVGDGPTTVPFGN